MGWDQRTATDADGELAVERFRDRLQQLAGATGVPVPSLTLPGDERTARWVRRHSRLPVSLDTLAADPANQDWTIASALAYRTAPAVRRRSRWGLGLTGLSGLLHLAWATLGLFDVVENEPLTVISGLLISGSVLTFGGLAVLRASTRVQDEVAFDILAAGGRSPVGIVRHVFRDTTSLPWWRRLEQVEPTDQERIAAAERHRSRPGPALH